MVDSVRVRLEATNSHGKVSTKEIPSPDLVSLSVTVIRSPVESISKMVMTVRLWRGKLLEIEETTLYDACSYPIVLNPFILLSCIFASIGTELST